MSLPGSSRAAQLGVIGACTLLGALGGCGGDTGGPANAASYSSSSGRGSSSGTSSGSPGSSGSSGGVTLSSSTSGGSGATSAAEAASEGGPSDDGATTITDDGPAADDAPTTTDAPACVKGQTPPSKVVVLGDSYLDHPVWSNAIPFLYTDLVNSGALAMNATYREYQLGGAAMNYGTLNLSIPYQYETTAKGDVKYANPKDIDTIIMDGGGNDVLIDNQECMTNAQPPPGNATCASAIQATVNRASQLLQEAATDGVKHIIFTFYPHLDPAGGGILPMPAPQVNATLDYAYPLAEEVCCGSSFTGTMTNYSCTGNTSGTECVFIDIRPAFEGHVADYIKSDHVHPTDAGAHVIADLIAGAMKQYCIAQ